MMVSKPSLIATTKTVNQTLSDLRRLFARYKIDDWEAFPSEQGPGYTVRYFRSNTWTDIGSFYQPSKGMNLRVCYQVIDNLFRWESRGVTGLVKGQAFMGGALIATERAPRESFDEACAVLGVDPDASVEEIQKVYLTKVQFAHPDKGGDPERFKRLQKAYDLIMKVKGKK